MLTHKACEEIIAASVALQRCEAKRIEAENEAEKLYVCMLQKDMDMEKAASSVRERSHTQVWELYKLSIKY